MNWKFASIRIFFALFLCAGFLLLALAIPAHLSGVDGHVLKEAGRDTRDVQNEIKSLIDASLTGPANLLAKWSDDEDSQWAINTLIKQHPEYRISGGKDAYFEQFLKNIEMPRVMEGQSITIMGVLAPADNRHLLHIFLKQSGVRSVKNLLVARELTNVIDFMPLNTAAGGPLESSILATALLAHGEYMNAIFIEEVVGLVRAAQQGDQEALVRLERFYMAILGSGHRLNWRQLAECVSRCKDVETFIRLVRQLKDPEKLNTFYTALILGNDTSSLIKYVEDYGAIGGYKSLKEAVGYGSGALDLLLERQELIFRPRPMLELFHRWAIYEDKALQYPRWALGLKFVALFLAIFCLSGGLVRATGWHRKGKVVQRDTMPIVRDGLISLFAMTLLLAIVEPGLPHPEIKSGDVVAFRLSGFVHNSQNALNTMNQITTNTSTLLIMLMFFVIQLAIYIIGLAKIAQVRGTEGTPKLKLTLLDNEENLFDCGLYVGLGGTVASLILFAMNVVSTGLISAYSSTLFGIIFVAILKIFHVRPFRRQLILKADEQSKR